MSFKDYLKEFGQFRSPAISSQFREDIIERIMNIIDEESIKQSQQEDPEDVSTEPASRRIFDEVISVILKNSGV